MLKTMVQHIQSSLTIYMRICWQRMSKYLSPLINWDCQFLFYTKVFEHYEFLDTQFDMCHSQCRFLAEKKAKWIRFCTSFSKMVIQLKSTCKDPEARKLTIGSSWIIMYKDVVYLLVLVSGLCGCIQSALKSTCPWKNTKKMEHLICLLNSISEFNITLLQSANKFSICDLFSWTMLTSLFIVEIAPLKMHIFFFPLWLSHHHTRIFSSYKTSLCLSGNLGTG